MAIPHPATDNRELAGQVALVTGGAKNIGRAISLALAAAGAAVAVNTLGSREDAEASAEITLRAHAGGGNRATARWRGSDRKYLRAYQ